MRYPVESFRFSSKFDPEAIKVETRKSIKDGFVQTAKASAARNSLFLEMIAGQTLRATETGNLLAKKPEIDFLLRLAGTTQISRAIKEVGSNDGKGFILVIAGRAEGEMHDVRGGEKLPAETLSKAEFDRVETAALLNAIRA